MRSKEAVETWTQACNDGDRNACHNAGFMFYSGDKIKQDYKKAKKLFNKACDDGSKIAYEQYKKVQ